VCMDSYNSLGASNSVVEIASTLGVKHLVEPSSKPLVEPEIAFVPSSTEDRVRPLLR
jgi:hypothetical protein